MKMGKIIITFNQVGTRPAPRKDKEDNDADLGSSMTSIFFPFLVYLEKISNDLSWVKREDCGNGVDLP